MLEWEGNIYFPTWCFVCCFKKLIQQQLNCLVNISALVFWAAAGKLPGAGLGQKHSPRGIWPGVPDGPRHPVYLWATGPESKSRTYFRHVTTSDRFSAFFSYSVDWLPVMSALWATEGLGPTFPRPLMTSAFCWNVPPGLGVWTPSPSSCPCMPFPSQNLIRSFLRL